ncbi:protein kinase domain-containing protein [Pyxidicoccus xibeiensis]|uniref:protein kinase domain-containing protein n=1 Tax=Pyxidicoccus xibeiensis TaxID=2906759 RepID=UPI0020A7443D|nr:protein kinase [Pyxidicoccus xibeiensis]MCP3141305.1 protein kinase [Pyxidicoccus xibeiensis]
MQVGKYQLVRKLASGGMAEVFLAKAAGPMGFEKTLVLKRILPHLAEDPAFVEMFLGEAKLAAQLEHPNIVQIFDFGEAEGSYFLAMELIDGITLRRLVKRAVEAPLPPAICAKLVAFAAEGLGYAHEFCDPLTGEPLGLIHRDVSPDNVLVSRQGAVKVVDFGIAKVAGQGHRTQTGVVKGKVAYMPPEQLQTKPLDRRVDVYALGVVLYELLTGKRPFNATTDVSVMQAILFEQFVPAVERRPDLPVALQQVLDRALAKDRDRRYPDCHALQADLERFVMSTGESVGAYQIARFVAPLVAEAAGGTVGATPQPRVQTGPKPATAPSSMQMPVDSTSPTTPMPRSMVSMARELPPDFKSAELERETLEEPAVDASSRPTARALPAGGGTARPTTQERSVSSARGAAVSRAEPGLAAAGGRGAGEAWKVPPAVVMEPGLPSPGAELPALDEDADPRADAEDAVHTRSSEFRAPGAPKRSGKLVAVAVGGVLLAVGGAFVLFGSGSEKAVPVGVKPLPQEPRPVEAAPVAAPPRGAAAPASEAQPATGKAAVQEPAAQGGPSAETAAVPAPPASVPAERTPPAAPASEPVAKAPTEKQPAAPVERKRSPPRAEPAAARGTLSFRIRPYANVWLNGRDLGQTPIDNVVVAEGTHKLRLFNKELGKDVSRTVEVKAGQTTVFKLNLEAE